MLSFAEFMVESKEKKKSSGTPVLIDNVRKKKKSSGTPVLIDNKRKKKLREETFPKGHVHAYAEDAIDQIKHGNDHIEAHPDAVAKELERHYPVPDKHYSAMRRYTDHSGINHELYSRHVNNITTPLDHDQQQDMNSLDSLTRRKLHTHLTTFAGTKFHPGEEAAKDPNHRLHLPAFTSTSIDPSVAHGFADSHPGLHGRDNTHVLRMHLPKGHPGFFFGSRSTNHKEHEFLLPRNTRLQVHHTPEVHHYINDSGNPAKLHVWDAHPVSHDED